MKYSHRYLKALHSNLSSRLCRLANYCQPIYNLQHVVFKIYLDTLQSWVLKLGSVVGSQGGCEYGSDILLKPFNDRKIQQIGTYVFGYNSPPAPAREVFKPTTDSASLVVPSQKTVFSFGFGVLLGGRHKWGCFRVFMAYFTRTWTPIEWAHVLAQICCKTRLSYESLEPLIGFLAYLDEKLCHKNQNVVKNPTPKKR